ncbi:MAG: DUF1080 domain-containing protein [Chryseolinea sp.]
MLKEILLTVVLATLIQGTAQSQNRFYKPTALTLSDLSGFKNPGSNWKIVGSVSGGFDDTTLKTEKGSGVLVDEYDPKKKYTGDVNLSTTFEHGDIFVSLDFMMPKGSNSGIYLQGRYEIQLFDSWNVNPPHSVDCGSIYQRWDDAKPEGKQGYEGHPPRVNASRAPNLWQHLDIEFKAPRFDPSGKKISPAQFVSVSLNGIVIHENVVLTGPTRASAFNDEKATGPLYIQGDHGPVAFRNISYSILDDFHINFTELNYEYFEGNFNDFTKVQQSDFVRKGKADAIDIKLADNPSKLCLIFTGKVNFKETTDYQFIVKKIGKAKLAIDGEEVIRTRELFDDYEVTKKLPAGDHTITFSYLKDFSWAPTGAGLYIGKLNARPQAMHTAASLPPLPPTPLIEVEPGREPERVRSFMEHHGKKKTHIISVGDPSGVHYAYDLDQAGLIQVWKGEFLNATDMWYERGEPQIAKPMGSPLVLSGIAPLALLATSNSTLPDTLDNIKDLVYKGYTLDAKHDPVFEYKYKDISFTDSFKPSADGKGLTRTIVVTGKPTGSSLVLRLGDGSIIKTVSENLYAVDDQRYYISFPVTGKSKPAVVAAGKQQALTWDAGANGSSTLVYTLYW